MIYDNYPHENEEPTGRLRINTWPDRTSPVLEQQWRTRIGEVVSYEWRKVPHCEVKNEY